jgi:hypothetical protein
MARTYVEVLAIPRGMHARLSCVHISRAISTYAVHPHLGVIAADVPQGQGSIT